MPYAMLNHAETKKLKPNWKLAPIVLDIFKMGPEHRGAAKIARTFNETKK